MYALHPAHVPVAHHDAHFPVGMTVSHLTPSATKDLLRLIDDNRFSAQAILQHLESADPGAAHLTQEQWHQIRDYCRAVWNYQTLTDQVAPHTQQQGGAGLCKLPSQLLPQHLKDAEADRQALLDIRQTLASLSKTALMDGVKPLLDSARKLEKLAAGMSLKADVIQRARSFAARCESPRSTPNACRLSTAAEFRELQKIKAEMAHCLAALVRLQPFVDAGVPKDKPHKWLASSYIRSLGWAQNAAMEGDWMEFENQMGELEAIAAQSGHVPDRRVSHA